MKKFIILITLLVVSFNNCLSQTISADFTPLEEMLARRVENKRFYSEFDNKGMTGKELIDYINNDSLVVSYEFIKKATPINGKWIKYTELRVRVRYSYNFYTYYKTFEIWEDYYGGERYLTFFKKRLKKNLQK